MWTSVLVAVLVLLALAVVFGGLLGFAAERFRVEGNPLVKGGSLAATVVVVAALVFGATNPDVVEDAAAKSRDAPCIEKIVRGFKITCPSE